MKIVVIGGTGLIGSKLVAKLHEHRQVAVAASPASGVNAVTGEGLPEVLVDASVVVDVSNAPDWDDDAVISDRPAGSAIYASQNHSIALRVSQGPSANSS